MDTLPDPTTLIDRELIDEWCSISADAENREERSAALAAELNKRHIDFSTTLEVICRNRF